MFNESNITKIISSDTKYLNEIIKSVDNKKSFQFRVLGILDKNKKNYAGILLGLNEDDFLRFILLNLSFSQIEINTYTALKDKYNSSYSKLAFNLENVSRIDLSDVFVEIVDLLNNMENRAKGVTH
ncbi:hypothetical protein ABFV74_06195 [Pseudoalteromonas distincta]|uniref:hypothetical protein n=1 Tax=Pseudoalteromonas distincta TaxID=77608 RepID=UPI003218C10C